jgi:hypothetical protein
MRHPILKQIHKIEALLRELTDFIYPVGHVQIMFVINLFFKDATVVQFSTANHRQQLQAPPKLSASTFLNRSEAALHRHGNIVPL